MAGTCDFKWMSSGGLLLDGNGDIAVTAEGTLDSIRDVAVSRVKAALNGWQLYVGMGADLQTQVGNTVSAEIASALQRQVQQSLTWGNFLPRGSFQVEVLRTGGTIQVLVFLNQQLIVQAMISNLNSTTPTVQVTS